MPEPIREYIEEVQKHLEGVTAYDGPDITLEGKLNFLRETRHAFGRTALVLSGGGALGAFHIVSPMQRVCSHGCHFILLCQRLMSLASNVSTACDSMAWDGEVHAVKSDHISPG